MFIEGISVLPFSDGIFVNQIVFDCAAGSPFVLDTETLLFGWYMEQARRETVGTWCFEVLSLRCIVM